MSSVYESASTFLQKLDQSLYPNGLMCWIYTGNFRMRKTLLLSGDEVPRFNTCLSVSFIDWTTGTIIAKFE